MFMHMYMYIYIYNAGNRKPSDLFRTTVLLMIGNYNLKFLMAFLIRRSLGISRNMYMDVFKRHICYISYQ